MYYALVSHMVFQGDNAIIRYP